MCYTFLYARQPNYKWNFRQKPSCSVNMAHSSAQKFCGFWKIDQKRVEKEFLQEAVKSIKIQIKIKIRSAFISFKRCSKWNYRNDLIFHFQTEMTYVTFGLSTCNNNRIAFRFDCHFTWWCVYLEYSKSRLFHECSFALTRMKRWQEFKNTISNWTSFLNAFSKFLLVANTCRPVWLNGNNCKSEAILLISSCQSVS